VPLLSEKANPIARTGERFALREARQKEEQISESYYCITQTEYESDQLDRVELVRERKGNRGREKRWLPLKFKLCSPFAA
jgi:hypothetical protein